MYKVLIADDERIIRKGLSSLINWGSLGLQLAGTAEDGPEAYSMILEILPDIVITDIKMPGMDGLELVRQINEKLPNIVFVILSGYSEFDFARKAMRFGVEHYLLKPCDEKEITGVLNRIIDELDQREKKNEFIKNMEYKMNKIVNQVRQEFLRDFIITGLHSRQDFEFFKQLFNIAEDRFKLILFEMEGECDYPEKFALKSIAEEVINIRNVYLSTIMEENVVILIRPIDFTGLTELIGRIKETFCRYYKKDFFTAISDENNFVSIPLMYKEALEYLKYRFYLGEGSIITKNDVDYSNFSDNTGLIFDYDKITALIKAGDIEAINHELDDYFDNLSKGKRQNNVTITYCIGLCLTIIRQGAMDELNDYIKKVMTIQEMKTLEQIFSFVKEIACEIALKNYENTTKKHSALIQNAVEVINKNIENKNLSLAWLAKEIMYLNTDYLGKLFYKETNEKFTQYVTRMRVEKAKELIESGSEYKIYEIAEKAGFGDNPRYFSQVFKKYTGCMPKEYKSR